MSVDGAIQGRTHANALVEAGRWARAGRGGCDHRESARGCGAYTQPRNGKGDAYRYCKRCRPGAVERKWTRELVLAAMLDWSEALRRLAAGS